MQACTGRVLHCIVTCLMCVPSFTASNMPPPPPPASSTPHRRIIKRESCGSQHRCVLCIRISASRTYCGCAAQGAPSSKLFTPFRVHAHKDRKSVAGHTLPHNVGIDTPPSQLSGQPCESNWLLPRCTASKKSGTTVGCFWF